MKRVLIITYYWPPSGGAGVQRWLKFCKYLPEQGWEPIVLTVNPGDATYPVTDESLLDEVNDQMQVISTPSKEWFSVYKKVSKTGKIPYAGFANEHNQLAIKQKIARFIRGNFFIPDPRKGWNKFAVEAAEKLISREHIDIIITTSPPHSTQLIGFKLSKKYKIPWIADMRDPWTDIYYYKQFYPTLITHKKNLRLEKAVLNNANVVTTVGKSLQETLRSKIHQSREKIKILSNGYDPDDFKGLSEKSPDKFTITYVGTLAETYPIGGFIEGIKMLLKDNPRAIIKFIGAVSDEKRNDLLQLPSENIELIPYVEHKVAISYMHQSSALLLIIPEHRNNKDIITGKIFEYLAVGRPILFLGPADGDGADIIKKTRAGEVINPTDSKGIYQALTKWDTDPPELTPPADYSRKNLTASLAAILDQLTGNEE